MELGTWADWASFVGTTASSVVALWLAVRKKVPDIRFSLCEKQNEGKKERWLKVENYDQVTARLFFFTDKNRQIITDMHLNPFSHRSGYTVSDSIKLEVIDNCVKQNFEVIDKISNHHFYIKVIIDGNREKIYRYRTCWNHKIRGLKKREFDAKLGNGVIQCTEN